MTSPDAGHWQIQEAKQRFSEMTRAVTSEGPQVITRHGEDVAVVRQDAEQAEDHREPQHPDQRVCPRVSHNQKPVHWSLGIRHSLVIGHLALVI